MNVVALLGLVVVAVGLWLWVRPRPSDRFRPRYENDVDHEELEEAEGEVAELDAFTTPEEADEEIPDWGPGAPKP